MRLSGSETPATLTGEGLPLGCWCTHHLSPMPSMRPKAVHHDKIKPLLRRPELRDTLHRHSPGRSSAVPTLKKRDRHSMSLPTRYLVPLTERSCATHPPIPDHPYKCGHTMTLCRLLPGTPAISELAGGVGGVAGLHASWT